MIRSNEKIKLKLFLPYGYTVEVLKVCEERNYTMPRGGKITAQDVRNTLNGRENLLIEEAIYVVAKINKEIYTKMKEKRDSILEK